MFTTNLLHEYLDQRPFVPIRLHLTDGSYHDIPHPEFAWQVGKRLYVARIVEGRSPDEPAVKEVALAHITHIEPIPRGEKKVKRVAKQ